MSRRDDPPKSKLPPFEACNQNGCNSGYVMRSQLENAKPVTRATPCECLLRWRERCKQEQPA